ncbi:MAG TPA: mercuric reductase [Gammaproteobacteria bacterium]|nr:mercuric reductase [Gammaproteobacteria bacterium]
MAMETGQTHDAIIIGTGQGGKPLAFALAAAGWRTAIVERGPVGGNCVNYGCTPTKTLVASARAAYQARRASVYGVGPAPVEVHMPRVRARKRHVVEQFRSGGEHRLQNADGLELIRGEARFTGAHAVTVHLHDGSERELAAPQIVIDTGSRPAVPSLPGLSEVPFLDSTSIMELDEVPAHLVILGGGYVGIEFAQMFRRFGSEVTVVQREEQLLAMEDTDIAEEIARLLREDGIRVLLGAHGREVRRAGDGVELDVRSAAGEEKVAGTHLLVAVGRSPNTDALAPAQAGVETDERGYLPVDKRLQTNVPGIFAIGDVNGGPKFTHVSYDDYRILRRNLLEDGGGSTRGRLVPYTVYMDPQLGRVGLTERQARAGGRPIGVARMPMNHVARALEVDCTRGLMKAVVDRDSERILGCAVLGMEGGELMSMVEIAMMADLPYTTLRDGIFAHPTLAESLNNLFANLEF